MAGLPLMTAKSLSDQECAASVALLEVHMWTDIKEKPEVGRRLLLLYESPTSGSREVYVGEFKNNRILSSGYQLNDIIAWQYAPSTEFKPSK